jgi:hypothetical protein
MSISPAYNIPRNASDIVGPRADLSSKNLNNGYHGDDYYYQSGNPSNLPVAFKEYL